MESSDNVKKVCSFCVSSWHFITTLIPYINEKENEDFEIFVEEDYTQKINTFLNKININKDIKKEIKNLKWDESRADSYNEIESRLPNNKSNSLIIVVKGTNFYIERINIFIEKWASKNKDKNVTVVNFYEVIEPNKNIDEILEKHEKILNASGEKNIYEIFGKTSAKSLFD